jgi:hypothetical protein
MSELDDRIRRALARQAGSLREQPDLDGLTDRITSRDRRRVRGLSIALVLALLVGPALWFVTGRGDGRAHTDVASGPGGDRVTVDDASSPLPTMVLGGSGSGGSVAALGSSTEVLSSVPYPGYTGPLARSFVREVDGTTIRVYRAAVDPPSSAGPPWWEPPPTCFPTGYVQADVSTADVVGIVAGGLYAERPDGPVGGTLRAVGIPEGAPRWVVVAQAPAGAAVVRATFPDGHVDEMEPVDGVAVLVGPASIDPDSIDHDASASLEALDADGTSLGSGTARSDGYGWAAVEESDTGFTESPEAACFGPQELPPPGPEQPADPAAARAEIALLFGVRYSDMTDDERLARLDDTRGMREVYDQLVNSSGFREQVLGSRTIFHDLVFMSATRAAVQYETEIPGYQPQAFGLQYGEVVLVDGSWKLSRESVCRDVQLAGISCPPVE